MEVGVLGPTTARRGGEGVVLGTRKQRALLAALTLHVGRPVPADGIVDLLWGDSPPPGVGATLQSYVAGLRRAIEPQRERRAPASVLVTVGPGYALHLPPDAVDAVRFDRMVTETHRAVPGAADADELDALVARLDDALALWRGEPFAELDDAPSVLAERARLAELRLLALEDRAVVELARGHHSTVAGELEVLTRAHPLRERLWALRALALARSQRQAEALEVLRDVRTLLDEELGIEPGPELRELQSAILRQDPSLDWRPPPTAPAAAPAAAPAPTATPGQAATLGPTATSGPAAAAPTAGHAVVSPGPAPKAGHAAVPPGREAAPAAGHPGDATVATDGTGGADQAAPGAEPQRRALALADPSAARWPMVGREAELATLTEALDEARAGRPVLAAVTGDPGIGKTRLVTELAGVARARGFAVLAGRCSQDDGAPPLWPWRPVLADLGHELPRSAPGQQEDDGAQFRAWESVVDVVRQAAARTPVLLVLDDLHWADRPSLRVLRLLAETLDEGRLLLVCTWRPHPPPREALADVAESLARRHALRLDLVGLDAGQAAEVVASVAHTRPSPGQAEALTGRTDGNPFFLVEYARLAAEGGDLGALLAEPDPPTAVHDVLVRRLERLPQPVRSVLSVASVVGREFDTATVAAASGSGDDDVLDLLEPAAAAGLVREEDVDQWMFAHALVRDTVYAALPATRRARVHARVAEALDGRGRETERARHWLAAGPSYAARAWPAAAAAAAATRRLHAHEESAELLVAALRAIEQDPDATDLDRWELLMQLVDAWRWSGQWHEVVGVEMEAVALAERLGDDERVATAAAAMTLSLWSSGDFGETNEVVVAALRRCLERLPTGDSRARCLVLLSLANELYFSASYAQRRGWIDEAVAMARRLGDRGLLTDALMVSMIALFEPGTARERLAWTIEAAELAETAGDERRLALALTLRVGVEAELGRVGEMWRTLARARREAGRLRHLYALAILGALEVPWQAMAGRFEECEDRMHGIARLLELMGRGEKENVLTTVAMALWTGQPRAAVPDLTETALAGLPVAPLVVVCLLRAGDVEEARRFAAAHPHDLDEHETWLSPLMRCCAAEAALGLGDATAGRRCLELLTPYAGHAATAGAHCALGPVDSFLALAAAAAGEPELATAHADRARELVDAWDLPLVAEWLDGLRERHGF